MRSSPLFGLYLVHQSLSAGPSDLVYLVHRLSYDASVAASRHRPLPNTVERTRHKSTDVIQEKASTHLAVH